MRLAFPLFHPAPTTGPLALPGIVAEALRRGHECRIYTPMGSAMSLPGAEVRALAVSGRKEHRRHADFIARLAEDMATDPVDIVAGFDPLPDLDVYFCTGGCTPPGGVGAWWARGRRVARYFAACEHALFAGEARIALLTEAQRAEVEQHYPRSAPRLCMLPAELPLDEPDDAARRRAAQRRSLEVGEGEHVLLFVGSDPERQGLDRAIHALGHARSEQPHQAMRLLVAGCDPGRSLRRLAMRLDLREQVQFLGPVGDFAELLLGADALVHPARREPVGEILLQAMAAGLPVIATEICGYATHIAGARAGLVLRSPFEQQDLDLAVLRTIDGIYRSQCRETGQVYARLTGLYPSPASVVRLLERAVA